MPEITATQVLYLAIGAVAAVVASTLPRRHVRASPTAATGLVVAALVARGQVPAGLAVVLAAGALVEVTARRSRGRPALDGPILLAAALSAAAASHAVRSPATGVLLLAVGALVIAIGAPRRAVPPWWMALAVGGCLFATASGGPDTEASIALWGAVVVAATISQVRGLRWHLPEAPLLLVTAWVAVDAYRGRPAGLPAAVVAIAGLVALVVVAPASARPPRHTAALAGLVALVSFGAARTIGLADATTMGATTAAGVLSVALVGLCGAVRARQAGGISRS